MAPRVLLTVISGLFFVGGLGCMQSFRAAKDGRSGECERSVNITQLISQAYRQAQHEISNDFLPDEYPPYIDKLLADEKLTVGLGIGTEDLGRVCISEEAQGRIFSKELSICGKTIFVEGRLILTRDAFKQGLEECEILFITTHSRFGAGPVFLLDGKDKPYRMQQTEDYEIVMPDSEISGYQGTVTRAYKGPLQKKSYVVFEPDSTDLAKTEPFKGYQMLALSTCTSKKHFLDDIAVFRGSYPTTGIFTKRACLMDTSMRIFMRFLSEIFQGKSVDEVVAGMNDEYRNVSWGYVSKKIPPWQVINNLYAVGINTVK